jgi:hypothetical protein
MPKNKNTVVLESTIRFMRLANGDDIISEIKDDGKISMILTNPMRVIVDADLDVGKQTIYMHTWMPQGIAKGNECRLNKKDVIFIAEIEQDISDYYKGMVFDLIDDNLPLKIEKKEKEYMDDDKKVITFTSKSNKDKLN